MNQLNKMWSKSLCGLREGVCGGRGGEFALSGNQNVKNLSKISFECFYFYLILLSLAWIMKYIKLHGCYVTQLNIKVFEWWRRCILIFPVFIIIWGICLRKGYIDVNLLSSKWRWSFVSIYCHVLNSNQLIQLRDLPTLELFFDDPTSKQTLNMWN
jgi:hypothetical protein